MPAILDEQTQFVDSSGKPLVNGKVYFGDQNADPVLNPTPIFSDRELTVVLANPQLLDSLGRTANKVWIAGRYSMRVDDLNDVQIYQELDNGESSDVGVTALENVIGANTITATATSTITAYEDLELYAFRAAQVNTTGVTLNIDGVGATTVVKNHDQPILPGEFEANQNVLVSRNETDDVFEWVNQNNKVIDFYEGTAVATATQPDIWVTDGNTFHWTGTTTVVDLADAPNIGAWRESVSDGAFTLTHGSGITLEGSANISIVAGDRISVYADAVDAFRAWVTKADGTAVTATQNNLVQAVNVQDGALATGTTVMPLDTTIPQNTEGDEYMTLAITPTSATNELRIDVTLELANSGNQTLHAALFQDTTADALASMISNSGGVNLPECISFTHFMVAGTVAETTFKVRGGGSVAGTTSFNGISGALRDGGVMASSITITEIRV